jgi:hypothetical protein
MSEQRVRDLINSPRRLHALLADRPRWHRICAALDALGDTQLAVDEYLAGHVKATSAGLVYLALYGILQVLIVQQDALKELADALKLNLDLPETLGRVREARNASTGHPTSYRHGKYSNTINRSSMSLGGFELYRWAREGEPEIIDIRVADLAREQREVIALLLEVAAVALETEEREHRERWRGDPLVPKLAEGITFAFQKLSEGLRNAPEPGMGAWGLVAIEERLARFRDALAQRGLLGAYPSSIDPMLAELEYPIGRLKEFLGGRSSPYSREDMEIFVSYVGQKIREVEAGAAEIDAEYASDVI